ncbi:hypothetical protein KW787_02950 [Candidatus Pacearchaeota archaeon]|nr:hypothetical protein [Candidatus Pacearchaeota archaeon]
MGKLRALVIILIFAIAGIIAKKLIILYTSSAAIELLTNSVGDLIITIILLIAIYVMRKISLTVKSLALPVYRQ